MSKQILAVLIAAASVVHAAPAANPLAKPAVVGLIAGAPISGPQGVQPMPSPIGIPSPVLSNSGAVGVSLQKEKDESASVAGMYVSVVMGTRAVLRVPVVSVGSPSGQAQLSYAPMSAAGPGGSQNQGSIAAPKSIVYRVNDGATLELIDGTKARVRIQDSVVSLSSVATKRVLFSGTLDTAVGAPTIPSDAQIVKPDVKYARSVFIAPLTTGGAGGGASGAVAKPGTPTP